jgi:hypothetical protein
MADELSPEARKALAGELVLVVERGQEDGTLYAHEAFLAAYQQALLDRIEFMVVPGMTARRAMRSLGRLRTPEAHQATLTDALHRLRRTGTPVDPTSLREGEHRVVAVLPFVARA